MHVTKETCGGSSTEYAAGGDGGNVTERMPPQLPHCTATVLSCRPPPHGTPTCMFRQSTAVSVRDRALIGKF